MFAILHALGMFVADLFKSRSRLEAENLLLRHQLTVALRRKPLRLRLRGSDRALLIYMTGFGRAFLMLFRWFSLRLSCAGIAQAFELSGAGSHEIGQGGQGSIVACEI